MQKILAAVALCALSYGAAAAQENDAAWITSSTCTASSTGMPRVGVIIKVETDNAGAKTTTLSLQVAQAESWTDDAAPKFSDVKVDVPGQQSWDGLSAVGRKIGNAFILTATMPDADGILTALTKGSEVSVMAAGKTTTVSLKNSGRFIKPLRRCLDA